jgi:hypothetical protein
MAHVGGVWIRQGRLGADPKGAYSKNVNAGPLSLWERVRVRAISRWTYQLAFAMPSPSVPLSRMEIGDFRKALAGSPVGIGLAIDRYFSECDDFDSGVRPRSGREKSEGHCDPLLRSLTKKVDVSDSRRRLIRASGRPVTESDRKE